MKRMRKERKMVVRRSIVEVEWVGKPQRIRWAEVEWLAEGMMIAKRREG
jgi:hypothetical protein